MIDLITYVARFWFILVALFILLRLVDHSWAEYNFRRQVREQGTGRFFGFLTIMDAPNIALSGHRYGIKWENTIGSGKRCDISIPQKGLDSVHATIYQTKKGTFLSAMGHDDVYVNRGKIDKRTKVEDADEIQLGPITLRLRLDYEQEWEYE